MSRGWRAMSGDKWAEKEGQLFRGQLVQSGRPLPSERFSLTVTTTPPTTTTPPPLLAERRPQTSAAEDHYLLLFGN